MPIDIPDHRRTRQLDAFRRAAEERDACSPWGNTDTVNEPSADLSKLSLAVPADVAQSHQVSTADTQPHVTDGSPCWCGAVPGGTFQHELHGKPVAIPDIGRPGETVHVPAGTLRTDGDYGDGDTWKFPAQQFDIEAARSLSDGGTAVLSGDEALRVAAELALLAKVREAWEAMEAEVRQGMPRFDAAFGFAAACRAFLSP